MSIKKKETYRLEIAGLVRNLPICEATPNLDIGAFVMFSDVELTIATATELNKLAPEHDMIITAESKGIPLAYEMSRQSGKKYTLARKSPKLYMSDPVKVSVKSITTEKIQALYMDRNDMEAINGKKVIIVDDVISTGESLNALEDIIIQSGGKIVARMAAVAEGDAINRKDIIYLAELPLFPK